MVDYEPLPAVIGPENAATDDVLLFPDAGTNVVQRFSSKSTADFADCEVVVAERIVNQRMRLPSSKRSMAEPHRRQTGRWYT